MKVTEIKYAVAKKSEKLIFLTADEKYTSQISESCLFSQQDAQDIANQMSDNSNNLKVMRVEAMYDIQAEE